MSSKEYRRFSALKYNEVISLWLQPFFRPAKFFDLFTSLLAQLRHLKIILGKFVDDVGCKFLFLRFCSLKTGCSENLPY